MTFTLPSQLFQIQEEDDQLGSCTSSNTREENTNMKLTDLSYDRVREATLTELYNISERAGIQDDENLSHSEDLRERLILMKRKMEGSSHVWKPLFRSVQGETKVKIDSLVHLMKNVEETFQTIPTESLSEILRKEGHLQGRNLLEEISTRMRNLKERRSLVVVAGETNGGKSTFLNLLLGEDILPTYVLHCTFAVCKIVYSDVYSIKTLDHDDIEEYFPCSSREEVKAILKNKVTQQETKEREFESPVKEITLGLPAEILKSGVVLVDTPGIGENEVMDSVTMNFLKSTHASAFIYIIKSDNAGGVQEDRLISFLRAIKDRYSSDEMMEAFDPRAAMFVCHRWDNIEEKHREKVKLNALSKLEYVWPGFDPSQTYFFSTTDTMKHLPVDPEFVTDSFMVLLKGLKHLFDRACNNAIKHQYVWLKYMLHPASHHLKSMITHCIMSNEELEDYFKSVSLKQNKLMISSTENSRKLQAELGKMSWELKSLISRHLNFDSISPRFEIQEYEEIVELCSRENFLVSQVNRRTLDEMIVRSLLKRVGDYVHLQKVVGEMESKILINIQDHLGLFKCQIGQIKHDMLHSVHPRISPSISAASFDDSATQLRTSTDSIASIGLNTSSMEAFQGIHTQGPSQLSEMVKNLLVRRKEGKSAVRVTTNFKHEIGQSLLGKIGDRLRHGVFSRTDPTVYVEERIQKVSRDIREDVEIMDSIVSIYTEWIQQCMNYTVDSIPKFIEVNTKLMEEIRDHRTIFQRNKDLLVKVMENLEPYRHNLRGYGMLYMDDINAETLAFNTEHRTSTVSLPKYLLTESGRSVDSGFQETVDDGLWSKVQGATIEVDNVASRVVIKTYTYDLDEKVILPEIASLRCLDYTNLAPFLGMTRIAAGSTRSKPSSPIDLPEKVSAFIFKGDLVSAKVYTRRKVNMQQFIPEMIQSLLRGLNYIHRERLVHMELNLKTVMVDKVTGTVKLCHMCKPREATFPADLKRITKSYVCLSPSVLEGNVYESTDDIYAFGLLLWELMFPGKLPFKEQRLWPLRRFIEKCHPSNMLQGTLSDLQVSDSIMDVLKGTLLISRGHVFMSIATIQSLLADLNNEPAVLCMRNIRELPDLTQNNSIILPAPEVKVISPSGTGTKLEFTYDGSHVAPKESSVPTPETFKFSIRKTYSSGKLSSLHEEYDDKKGNGLIPPKAKRSTSESDINNIESSSTKLKKKPFKLFWNKLFKIGSSKKSLGEDLNPSKGNNIIDSNSRRGSMPMPHEIDEIKKSSVQLEFSMPEFRQKSQPKEPVNENTAGSRRREKYNSLPNQSFVGSKTGSLARQESFDVPTLMSEKFRLSLGNRLPRKGVSRLNPLSDSKSDFSLSGSMPSLLFLNESKSHNNTESQQKQNLAKFLACSSNPRMQTQISPSLNSKTSVLTAPQAASPHLKQDHHLGESLCNLCKDSLNHSTYSEKHSNYLLDERMSAPDLHDKLTEANLFLTNAISSQKANSWHFHQRSPLTMTDQNVTPIPIESSILSNAVSDVGAAESKSILHLSSSTSSREADSGFSTDASGQQVKDLLGSYDDLESSFSLGNSIGDNYQLNSDTSYSFIPSKSQNVQTNNLAQNVGKLSPHTSEDDRGDYTTRTMDLSLQGLTDDSDGFVHKYINSPRGEPLHDTRNSSPIPPPPPPIDFSQLSFINSGCFDDEDSDD